MAEPLNLLALDGGGVRGLSEAVILNDLMIRIKTLKNLPYVPKPCDCFHMIGGTSTGGLLAIMLGRMQMSTEEAIVAYQECSESIFRKQNKKKRGFMGYHYEPLVRAVQGMVASRKLGDTMYDASRSQSQRGHSFVCAVRTTQPREPVHFRSYNSRAENGASDCFIWEAARATTAAPTFFERMAIDGIDYFDGAVAVNNPAERVLHEAASLFGADRHLGCLLSIGTGLGAPSLDVAQGLTTRLFGGVNAKQLGKLLKDCMTDCETVHKNIQQRVFSFKNSYFRFNVDGEAKTVKLDAYKKMDFLKILTLQYIGRPEVSARLDEVARTVAGGLTEDLTLGKACYALPDSEKPLAQPEGDVSNFFIGRQDVLSKLSSFFDTRPQQGPRPRREFMIGGMGGMGKTQIALQFRQAYEYLVLNLTSGVILVLSFPGGVFWIDGSSEVTVEQSYRTIAMEKLGMDEKSATMRTVLSFLDGIQEEWLLLFDDRWDKSIEHFLPKRSRGNILYTTRHVALKSQLPRNAYHDLDVLGEQDSVELLLNVAGKDDEDRDAAATIVELLGYLPLGLDLYGKFMRNTYHDFVSYVQMLKDKEDELRAKTPGFEDLSAANRALYASFDISYFHLRSIASSRQEPPARSTAAAAAIALLDIVSFYHNTGFLEETIERVAMDRHNNSAHHVHRKLPDLEQALRIWPGNGDEGGKWDPVVFRTAMSVLCGLSLMRADFGKKGSYGMHVLLHGWVRTRMVKTDRWAKLLVARYLLFASTKDKSTYQGETVYRAKTIPHIMACRFKNGQLGPPNGENNLTEYFQDSLFAKIFMSASMHPEAIALQEHVLYVVETFVGGPKVTAYRDLTEIYGGVNWQFEELMNLDFERAVRVFDACISACSERYGVYNWRVVEETINFADFYASHNYHNKAGIIFAQAVAIGQEGKRGPDGRYALRAKQAYAKYLIRELTGDVKPTPDERGGIMMLHEVLSSRLRVFGEHDRDTMEGQIEYCQVPSIRGREDVEDAELRIKTLRNYVEIAERMYGPSHHNALDIVGIYGALLVETGRLEEAETVLWDGIRRSSEALGETHVFAMSMIVTLTNIMAIQGRWKEAVDLIEERLETSRMSLNADNMITRFMGTQLEEIKGYLRTGGIEL
ncbi:uncharacterized protein MKZ38_002513 [Zalerion maritima]|uniref:PNPLA domain-containing protein n=1 Tax=Zalerion maritima TaxID=339359 RepID=A0AAD5RQ56_9PEZI|nr:uncharacterized protein MKZ38_002513 [Zalerion maritima]